MYHSILARCSLVFFPLAVQLSLLRLDVRQLGVESSIHGASLVAVVFRKVLDNLPCCLKFSKEREPFKKRCSRSPPFIGKSDKINRQDFCCCCLKRGECAGKREGF